MPVHVRTAIATAKNNTIKRYSNRLCSGDPLMRFSFSKKGTDKLGRSTTSDDTWRKLTKLEAQDASNPTNTHIRYEGNAAHTRVSHYHRNPTWNAAGPVTLEHEYNTVEVFVRAALNAYVVSPSPSNGSKESSEARAGFCTSMKRSSQSPCSIYGVYIACAGWLLSLPTTKLRIHRIMKRNRRSGLYDTPRMSRRHS